MIRHFFSKHQFRKLTYRNLCENITSMLSTLLKCIGRLGRYIPTLEIKLILIAAFLQDLSIMNWTTNFGFDDDEDLQPKKHKEPSRAKKPKLDATKVDSMSLDPSFTFKAPRTAKKESQVSWSDTYEPKSVTDLVIHHKKVEDLEAALKSCDGKIVLLTGPSGSGKTVSLKCICKKLNIGKKISRY